jgi:hypothetical protein
MTNYMKEAFSASECALSKNPTLEGYHWFIMDERACANQVSVFGRIDGSGRMVGSSSEHQEAGLCHVMIRCGIPFPKRPSAQRAFTDAFDRILAHRSMAS